VKYAGQPVQHNNFSKSQPSRLGEVKYLFRMDALFANRACLVLASDVADIKGGDRCFRGF
jgi:hypothetical protein